MILWNFELLRFIYKYLKDNLKPDIFKKGLLAFDHNTIIGMAQNTYARLKSNLDEVNRINKRTKYGTRRVRIHAVGFPVMLEDRIGRGNTGERFATLMRILCQKNGGTFVGLNSTRR